MKRLRLSNKVRTAFQGRSRGLTLVELVIAIALIGIIAVALLGGLSNAIMALHFADVQATAESLARSEMEYERTQLYEDAPWGPEDLNPPGFDAYTVTRSAKPLNEPDEGIQEITIEVFHRGRSDDEPVITLVGYKRRP